MVKYRQFRGPNITRQATGREVKKMTIEKILDMAYSTAIDAWGKEMEHLEKHPGKLAQAWERKAWEDVEELQRIIRSYKETGTLTHLTMDD